MIGKKPATCKECDGEGRIWGARTNDPSERERWLGECDRCHGTGYEPEEGEEE